MDLPELFVGHGHQAFARPHPVCTTTMPGGAGQPRRHMDDQHAPAFVAILFDVNTMSKPLVQACFGSTRLGERLGAHHAPRSLVSNPENDTTSSLIGKRNAVFRQVVKGESTLCCLELDTASLRALKERAKFLRRGHLGTSARERSSERL
jgi:GMP synthase-like glutamine amidotransferase